MGTVKVLLVHMTHDLNVRLVVHMNDIYVLKSGMTKEQMFRLRLINGFNFAPIIASLFNLFWFFFNFKKTTKFHLNLSKSIHSFINVDSFTQSLAKIFQIVELFLWEFPTATAISHQV
ncbi:hypothetical protein MSSAC_1876 [Methanosarcina siciliae C2J]|uniref:Uncharacterized protein n=1 Tax=Methanosarcina siciliae C2J TaxID=1434118 RepID=A0A0E3LD12_9EURY|nr:hypothetical protein MSSAC_1876 [Methanosarcina siciliae C2J]